MILKKMYLAFILLVVPAFVFAVSDKEKSIEYFKSKGGIVREKKGDVFVLHLTEENNITDIDLQYVINFPNLRIISLYKTTITSDGLKFLSNMIKLESIDLRGTNVDDSGMKYLKGLEFLRELDLVNTKVTDEGIQELASLKNLDMLKLRGTKVTQKGINRLQKKLPDCYITLETDEEIQ
jgi:Leucine-rich repeat (LRR) protein